VPRRLGERVQTMITADPMGRTRRGRTQKPDAERPVGDAQHEVRAPDLLDQVVQSLSEGVAIADDHGHVVFANKALEQLLGYETGEMTGLPWTALFPDRPDQQADALPGQRADETNSRYEAWLLCKDGTTVPVLASSRPLSNGDRVRLSTFTDLRERHQLEAQVQQLGVPALMGEQIGSVIHELNNSLTIVSLQAQLLSKKVPVSQPLEESLTAIREQTKRMSHLVDSLRVAADPRQVNLETIDLHVLIEQTLELHAHPLRMEGIEVITDLRAVHPAIAADPQKLQQVFVNLINNARQALAVGQGKGQGSTRRLTVATRWLGNGGGASPRIQVRFADNGPGIPADVMPHIFEPFFTTRCDRSADGGRPMGLGLSICEQIVRNHGGRIWAENNAEGGATIVLELPALGPSWRETGSMPEARPGGQRALKAPYPTAPKRRDPAMDEDPPQARRIRQLLGYSSLGAT
jgi:PAS domain S-box-containing protein